MEEVNFFTEESNSILFMQLKASCLELLQFIQHPNLSDSSAIFSMLRILRSSSSQSLQPFLDYCLFPLLLLLDASVNSRSLHKEGLKVKSLTEDDSKMPRKISDRVAEGVLECLEELLTKCYIGSVEQMVVVLKKLTYAALLSTSEASEEFRQGAIKCFKALLLSLPPCSDQSCSCKQLSGSPTLLESKDLQTSLSQHFKSDSQGEECLLAFLQSQNASAAVGHWLSLLLKVADTEASLGQRGSAKLRAEAFMTLRVLVTKVGTSDPLAFFLPGVVSQLGKVLHVSKTMISGAAGSTEATGQAIRGLAEYIMIVFCDDTNLRERNVDDGFNSNAYKSTHSFLEELRQLPIKAQPQHVSVTEDFSAEVVKMVSKKTEHTQKNVHLKGDIGSLHVNRTGEWIEKTSIHVNKLLSATFPHICVHPSRKVRNSLLAAIQGLLSRCSQMLKESRLMLLECLCVLVVDDSEEVSTAAQQFLEYLFLSYEKLHIKNDVAEIFSRLIEKLPKVVLGSEEAFALSYSRQLLVVIYFSGPQFMVDHLRSPATAARFLDVFSVSLSLNSAFSGSLEKLILARTSSVGYLQSVAELKASSLVINECQDVINASPSDTSNVRSSQGKYELQIVDKGYQLPRMPPWFTFVGNEKLYQVLSGVLRLVGLSLLTDLKSEGHLSVVTDIPLGYLRKLVFEIRAKDYNRESWQQWYNRIGSGQLLHQASTAVCILNEMIFGMSDQAVDTFTRMFNNSRVKKSNWTIPREKVTRSQAIDCIGKILHEYVSPEIWELPVDPKSPLLLSDGDVEDPTLHFFRDVAMLQQVILEGIGIFALCLGKEFASSGYLHLSLYLLLENLICSNSQVRSASDAVLHVLAAATGYPSVGHLVLENADYVIDSVCRQLRNLDLNPHVPNVLAALLSYIGVANRILPLLEEPMRTVSKELEILGRHQHPDLTLPFLKAISEIAKASKREAFSLPEQGESYSRHVEFEISNLKDNAISEQWESILFKLNESKRYRRTIGSIAGSCLIAATPLLASKKQTASLVALNIIEDGISTLAKVEEAYKLETKTKEKIEEVLQSFYLYDLKDTMDASDDSAEENRLLPAVNKIWPFLVICIQSKDPVAIKRCASVVSSVVQICGGDFFSRRFQTDGSHFWKLLSTSPFSLKPNKKDENIQLQLPYRSKSVSPHDSLAEGTSLKVQISVLNMIADLSRNPRSASALELVLKKLSGLVVGIACSGVVKLRDAAINALCGLSSIDPDLIWLLLTDVYYSLKKRVLPLPPSSDFPEVSQILPLPLSPKEFLYVQYGGQTYGFEMDFSSVEAVYMKLHSLVYTNQIYC